MRSASNASDSRRWPTWPVQQTRGLNKNFNHALKTVYNGAGMTVVDRARGEPLYQHCQRLFDGGTKPNLAEFSIARQIAAIHAATDTDGAGKNVH